MEWKDIKTLLTSKSDFFFAKGVERVVIAKGLTEFLKVPVGENNILVKNNTIMITAHPAVKNEVMLKKTELLGFLKKLTGNSFSDVR